MKKEQDEIMKLQTFNSSYFRCKRFLEDYGTQNYLVIPPIYKAFKAFADTNKVTAQKSKGLSDKSIKPTLISDKSLNLVINYILIMLKYE